RNENANAVFVFGFDGSAKGPLVLPATNPSPRSRALACSAARIFVADAASGAILVFDATATDPLKSFLGEVPDFRAPVSAMACDGQGKLYVKFESDDSYAILEAAAGYAQSGRLA